jgi:DNA-damage-inducible protein J
MHSVLTKERLFAMTTSLTIRMDDTLKAEAEDFFDDIGMNMTTAITCFFKKCLATGEIPFKISRQSKRERLLAAVREANEIANDPNAEYCDDPAKLKEFLLS